MLIHSVDGCFSIFRALTYYKEVEHMKSLDFTPDLLLLHDWPVTVGERFQSSGPGCELGGFRASSIFQWLLPMTPIR